MNIVKGLILNAECEPNILKCRGNMRYFIKNKKKYIFYYVFVCIRLLPCRIRHRWYLHKYVTEYLWNIKRKKNYFKFH